jgi:hypothetical protein
MKHIAPLVSRAQRPFPFPPPHSPSKTGVNALSLGEGRVGVAASWVPDQRIANALHRVRDTCAKVRT